MRVGGREEERRRKGRGEKAVGKRREGRKE
jgi:hypothetical protein